MVVPDRRRRARRGDQRLCAGASDRIHWRRIRWTPLDGKVPCSYHADEADQPVPEGWPPVEFSLRGCAKVLIATQRQSPYWGAVAAAQQTSRETVEPRFLLPDVCACCHFLVDCRLRRQG